MITKILIAATLLVAVALFTIVKVQKVMGSDTVKDPTATADKDKPSPLDFKVKDIDGKDVNLADYKGKVVLIVNVASKCGNTPQYKPLEAMYEKYKDQGFVILGFPANDFGKQEPGSNDQIKAFCSETYKVAFPMFAKITVKGDEKAPIYKFLTEPATNGEFAGDIEWNFQKFLVDRNGAVIARFSPKTKPDSPKVVAEVEKALAAK
jgi:glutathione peroxidase